MVKFHVLMSNICPGHVTATWPVPGQHRHHLRLSNCHRWHLHQSRGRLGAWVSRGNQPLAVIIGSVSTYLLLWLMTLVPVIVCRHLPPLAPSIDVPVTSTYVCVFWMLPPPSVWRVVRLEDKVIMTSSWDRRSRTRLVFKRDLSVLGH